MARPPSPGEPPNVGSFIVKRDGVEVVRLGNIAGKPGVPPTVEEGLWGGLGAGIFIQGAPRMVLQSRLETAETVNVPANSAGTLNKFYPIVSAPFTVPAGRRLMLLAALDTIIPGPTNNTQWLGGWEALLVAWSAGSGVRGEVPAGDYDRLDLFVSLRVLSRSSVDVALPVTVGATYIVYEFDG